MSLDANKTVMGKSCFEQWLWDQCVSKNKNYHGDNGFFSLLRNTILIVTGKDKVNLSLGLVLNAKNAHAERAIQTIM